MPLRLGCPRAAREFRVDLASSVTMLPRHIADSSEAAEPSRRKRSLVPEMVLAAPFFHHAGRALFRSLFLSKCTCSRAIVPYQAG